jgi:hypothetical protein
VPDRDGERRVVVPLPHDRRDADPRDPGTLAAAASSMARRFG